MKELDYFKTLCEELNTTNSKLEKAKILAQYPQCKELIELTMNPYKKYHVTSKNIEKLKDKVEKTDCYYDNQYQSFKHMLDCLMFGDLSGHDAIYCINDFIKRVGEQYRNTIYNIIDKDMKVRMGDKEVNKVFPNLIPTFDVCLANKADEKQMKKVDKNWLIERKLDGCRCIVMYKDGDVKFYSRKGHEFTTLGVLKESIINFLVGYSIKSFVIDSEICLVDENGKEDFQGIMKVIKKKGHTIVNPKLKMFDLLTLEEFENKMSSRIYSDRYEQLRLLFSTLDYAEIIECLPFTPENMALMTDKVNNEGWEGLMLRNDVGYEGKRTNNLLKVKKFYDDEYVVEGIESGPFRVINKETRLEETITTLTNVLITHKGHEVSVGSGFTLDQRKHYFKNPYDIVGKTINVQYFEETKNKDGGLSLRFPTIKYVYENGRTV